MQDAGGSSTWSMETVLRGLASASTLGWFDDDVVAIDLGLAMLMAENQQTGAVYRSMERHPGLRNAMDALQLKKYV